MQHVHGNMFDFWVQLVVHLLILKSSVDMDLQPIQLTSCLIHRKYISNFRISSESGGQLLNVPRFDNEPNVFFKLHVRLSTKGDGTKQVSKLSFRFDSSP